MAQFDTPADAIAWIKRIKSDLDTLSTRVNSNGRTVSAVIRGSDGATIGGAGGCSVARTGTGVYTVTFNSAFSSAPAIGLSVRGASPIPTIRLTSAYGQTGFTVGIVIDGTTTAVDTDWSFNAHGSG